MIRSPSPAALSSLSFFQPWITQNQTVHGKFPGICLVEQCVHLLVVFQTDRVDESTGIATFACHVLLTEVQKILLQSPFFRCFWLLHLRPCILETLEALYKLVVALFADLVPQLRNIFSRCTCYPANASSSVTLQRPVAVHNSGYVH